jgi:hypothetical protein
MMKAGPVEFSSLILDFIEYFERQGWSSEYAHRLLTKQTRDLAISKLRAERPGEAEGLELILPSDAMYRSFAIIGTKNVTDYIQLVDKICEALSPYKSETEIKKMHDELTAIVLKHTRTWGL